MTMLITFKSAASGDVLMFEQNAQDLLRVLGKHPNEAKGIVTVEQLPDAIAAIKSAIAADKAANRGPVEMEDESGEETESGDTVRLSMRALPFLELLERSLKDEVPVTWGV
ncbi:MAG: DUF1840 domain-containing protein [Formivibrio sp.]|nr:DUF1840 domain-containing protein [Formivibrio sp.]